MLLRQSKLAQSLLTFDEKDVLIESAPKTKLTVISQSDFAYIKIGRKIKINPNDTIIIVMLGYGEEEFVISISKYLNFNITKEEYFSIVERKDVAEYCNIEIEKYARIIEASIKSLKSEV